MTEKQTETEKACGVIFSSSSMGGGEKGESGPETGWNPAGLQFSGSSTMTPAHVKSPAATLKPNEAQTAGKRRASRFLQQDAINLSNRH